MSSTLRYLGNEKILAAIVPAGLLLLGSPFIALASFIILGQGHFLIAYLYQYRGGKMNKTYIVWYLILASLIFFVVLPSLSYSIFLALVAAAFAIHFFFDEARLLERGEAAVSLSLTAIPVVWFIATLYTGLFSINYLPLAACASLLLLGITWWRNTWKIFLKPHVWYVNSASFIFIVLWLNEITIDANLLFGAIILYHIASWYIHFYVKLTPSPTARKRYLKEVVLINALLIGSFLLYINSFMPALKFVFDPVYYYAWALLHIQFSSHDLVKLIKKKLGA